MKTMHFARGHRRVIARVLVGALLPVAMLATASGGDTTTATNNLITLKAPALSNVPSLPFTGVTAAPATLATTVGNLSIAPYVGTVGTPFTISGTGLAPNTTVQLTWATSTATWVADVEPNTVNYMGRSASALTVNLATVTTDASGNFSIKEKAPADFGGVHDIYAVIDGVEVAHGGFEMLRSLTVTPKSGPIGTPITITYTGMGATLYTTGAAVLWDNHYVGEMTAAWTRGTATVTIRAAGPIGAHNLYVGDSLSSLYLNIIQSPVPYANGAGVTFTTTRGHLDLAPSISWPPDVKPTVNQVTTVVPGSVDPQSTAVAKLSATSGPVNTKADLSVTGLSGSGTLQVVWSTVVGSRVNCPTSSCWAYESVPLGTGTITNGNLKASITIPDGLGGWHVVQVLRGSAVEAQVPFYVKESMVPFYDKSGKLVSEAIATATTSTSADALANGQSGTGTYTFKQGQEMTISLKGVGWTQIDNTLAVDYDNSYMGYGCGFNSNGYTVIHLRATGRPGVHIIDLYPQLYTQQPSFANTPYGMAPVLTYASDFPGLALGYQVPSFHFAIRIVK
ncbi:MAG TPA: hypothetical protein VMV53_05445 [Acidimicrobiales bacterium]|nr:hypothetical protein [Acidimicrobiales bacterium]